MRVEGRSYGMKWRVSSIRRKRSRRNMSRRWTTRRRKIRRRTIEERQGLIVGVGGGGHVVGLGLMAGVG